MDLGISVGRLDRVPHSQHAGESDELQASPRLAVDHGDPSTGIFHPGRKSHKRS